MSFLYPICKIVANLLINFLIYNSETLIFGFGAVL